MLGALIVGSCSDSTSPPTATTIQLSATSVTLTALTATRQFTATVLDQNGSTMSDAVVTWAAPTPTVATVSGTGLITAVGNGAAQVTATSGNATASVSVTVAQNPVPPTSAAGATQTAALGLAVPVKPAVLVADSLGRGIAGIVVNFSVTSGGGSVSGAAATTNASGVATVGEWILGPSVGANTLSATYLSFPPVLFTANGIIDPCTAAGAAPIQVGESVPGFLASTDCTASEATHYDLYRLELATSRTLIIGMTASFDAYLKVFNATTGALVAENDDIILGVIQDSRIAMTFPAGSYLIRTRSFDPGQFGSYALSIIEGFPGVPFSVSMNAGNSQVVTPGSPVPIAPSVIVRDVLDSVVVGAQVTFETVPTVGAITGAVATTNSAGIATVGSWTLDAGANVLSATVTGGTNVSGNPVVFSASGNASTAGFNIDLKFRSLPTLVQLQAFRNAATKWETVITNDLPAQPLILTAGQCSGPALNETVDDLAIHVILEPIDGAGQVLGSAGPCALRPPTGVGLTVLGVMRFDTADLPALESQGRLDAVILHEMGHVLGIGTLWSRTGLLLSPSLPSSSGADTRFTGTNSIAGFDAIGGTTYTLGGKVPVENTAGGAGTRDSHWRESVLQNELMTGFLNSGTNPMSMLTVRSMVDLGYTVNTGAADPFFLTLSLRAEGSTNDGVWMVDDIWQGPRYVLSPSGRPIGASLRQK